MEIDVNIRAVLALADKSSYEEMYYMLKMANVNVVGFADDGLKALQLTQRMMPDILLSDMILPVVDGLELIFRVNELRLDIMPAVIFMSYQNLEHFENRALKAGAFRILHKPVTKDMLIDMAKAVDADVRLTPSNVTEERIYDHLAALGLKSKLPGTKYLCTAILFVSKDSRLLESLTTKLYPMVAKKYGVDGKCVERGMRRAIESACSTGALDAQHAIFGDAIDAWRGKPTCGGMIARIVDLLRTEE